MFEMAIPDRVMKSPMMVVRCLIPKAWPIVMWGLSLAASEMTSLSRCLNMGFRTGLAPTWVVVKWNYERNSAFVRPADCETIEGKDFILTRTPPRLWLTRTPPTVNFLGQTGIHEFRWIPVNSGKLNSGHFARAIPSFWVETVHFYAVLVTRK